MFEAIEILRPVPVTLLAVLTVLAWKQERGQVAWLLSGLLVSAVAFHFLREIFHTGNLVGSALVLALLVPTPPLLWLLAESVFSDDFRIERRHIGIVLGSSVFLFLFAARTFIHRDTRDVPLYYGTALLAILIVLVFATLLLVAAVRNIRSDLVESRRIIRGLLLLTAGINILAFAVTQVVGFLHGGNYMPYYTMWMTVTSSLNLFVTVCVVSEPSTEFFPQNSATVTDATPENSPVEQEEVPLRGIIDKVMSDGLYRKEDLSIRDLAQKSKVPEYKVRKTIREVCGFRNFNQYVNGFRIAEAARLLREGADDKITAIAFEVGFNSIAPFNRAFREVYGVTPSAYRKQQATQAAG